MYKLTKEILDNHKQWEIIHSGFTTIEHPRFNHATNCDVNNRTVVKFVLVKMHGDYWTIYHSMDWNLEYSDYFDWYGHLLASNRMIHELGARMNEKEAFNTVWCEDVKDLYYI